MSREGQDTINRFNHGNLYEKERVWIPLNSLTMEIYISREVQDTINRFNHGDLYIKRELRSH